MVLALLAAAVVELNFAGSEDEGLGYWMRLVAAAFTLGIADGALSGSILGNRSCLSKRISRDMLVFLFCVAKITSPIPSNLAVHVGQYRSGVYNY